MANVEAYFQNKDIANIIRLSAIDQQIGQLYELMNAIRKGKVDDGHGNSEE